MNESELSQNIEAILFAAGGPLSRAELARALERTPQEVEAAVARLQAAGFEGRGVVLVDDGTEVELRAAPAAAAHIERLRREELSQNLGRAGAEVIAVLLYRGASTRAGIDFIRGVNSSAALRTLLMRGLVRRIDSKGTALYELTTELIASLGLARMSDAPDFADIRERLQILERAESQGGDPSNLSST